MSYSSFHFVPIHYSPLSPFWPRYRGLGYKVFTSKVAWIPDPYAELLVHFRVSRFDLVHSHGHPFWLSLYRALGRRGVPRVHTVHQVYYPDESRSEKERLMREGQNTKMVQVCRDAIKVIAVSRNVQEVLEQRYGLQSVCIPNGIDMKRCEQGSAARFLQLAKQRAGFILYVGSLLGVKRPELLCEIARKMPSLTFVAIGPGLSLPQMKDLFGILPENIVGLGELPNQTVIDAMHACGAVLVTSKREAFCYTVLEGFACGKPVVGPEGSGVEDIIAPISEQLLFDDREMSSIEESLHVALQKPDLGTVGQRHVARQYDWRRLIVKVDALYEEALEEC